LKPGNAGGGKGPEFKANARSGERAGGLTMRLIPTTKVRKLQEALQAKAKRAPTYRFYALYDKLHRFDVLEHALARCRENGGAPGVDGQTFADIEAYGEEKWLGELAEELKKKTYRPQAVRRVWRPKPDGTQRPLGIPTIRDRVVQMAAVLILGPIFEADLQPEQHAYRPDHNALDAVRATLALVRTGHTEVVDADLSGYFDSIPHSELMKSLARRISDRHMLHLLKAWLEMPVEETDERGRTQRTTRNRDEKKGTPQGAPISPLLANLYMRRFIVGWKALGHEQRLQARLVNYADDFVICCRGTGQEAMAVMRDMMAKLKLTVNEKKTRLCRLPEETFDFLGYTIGRCHSSRTGRAYLGTKPAVKKVRRICDELSESTRRKTTRLPVGELIGQLNRMLVGWANYFCLGAVSRAYRAIDQHVCRRLRQWLCVKHKVQGQGFARYPDKHLYQELRLQQLAGRPHSLLWAKA
jgi:group II intron reverse transcriptase/maturase